MLNDSAWSSRAASTRRTVPRAASTSTWAFFRASSTILLASSDACHHLGSAIHLPCLSYSIPCRQHLRTLRSRYGNDHLFKKRSHLSDISFLLCKFFFFLRPVQFNSIHLPKVSSEDCELIFSGYVLLVRCLEKHCQKQSIDTSLGLGYSCNKDQRIKPSNKYVEQFIESSEGQRG